MEFTDGFDTFAAPEDSDVVIESVRSIGDSDEVTVIGTLLSGPLGENGIWQSFDAYPPVEGLDGDTFEAAGARIPAGSGHYQILIGYRGDLTRMSVGEESRSPTGSGTRYTGTRCGQASSCAHPMRNRHAATRWTSSWTSSPTPAEQRLGVSCPGSARGGRPHHQLGREHGLRDRVQTVINAGAGLGVLVSDRLRCSRTSSGSASSRRGARSDGRAARVEHPHLRRQPRGRRPRES